MRVKSSRSIFDRFFREIWILDNITLPGVSLILIYRYYEIIKEKKE